MYDLCKAVGEARGGRGSYCLHARGARRVLWDGFHRVLAAWKSALSRGAGAPTHPTDDLFASVRAEVDAVLEKKQAGP